MSAVKPEFGPTLAELLAPRPRAVRLAVAALGAVVVLVVAALAIRTETGSDEAVLVTEPVVFNLAYESDMRKVSGPGSLLALERRRDGLFLDSYVVRTLTLAPYRGAASGELPVFAFGYIERLRRRYPGFALFSEGRTRINNAIGYQILFRARRGERTIYGRHLLLVGDELPGLRRGVVLELTSTPTATSTLAATGNQGALKTPLRSFRFGRERKGGEA